MVKQKKKSTGNQMDIFFCVQDKKSNARESKEITICGKFNIFSSFQPQTHTHTIFTFISTSRKTTESKDQP